MSIIVCDSNHTMYTLLTRKELAKTKRKIFKKDQVLFRENDVCQYVGIVESGELVIRTISNNGKEVIYAKVKDGQLFGNNLIFADDKRYKGDVIAFKDGTVILIDEKTMLEILQKNNKFLLAYLNEQANIVKDLNSRIKLLSKDSIEDRFLFYLKEHNNYIKYDSITSLSKEIGVQRETLSRLISRLKKDNVIIQIDNIIKRA